MKESLIRISDLTSVNNLAKEEKKAIFKIETGILRVMVNKLIEKGFYWFLPVILAKSTDPLWPDAQASIEQRIEIEIYNEKVKTMQSMIIHKRILVSSGIEKIFLLSPNIRIERKERAKTGRHLYEFTQLDVEAAYWKMNDIFKLFEELIVDSIIYVKKNFSDELKILKRDIEIPETPFKTFKRRELEKNYGEKWELTISKTLKNPVWVTDIPREFYDYEDEEKNEWRNFDLILPEGYGEVISGAEREYEYKKIVKKIERDGLNKNDYKIFLSFAKEGKLKPSTGAGLGVERFVSYVCGVKHVAEVQPFPRIPGIVPEL
ncbi:MAG: asparagine synthetase A [Candidatus Bathyarchaeia archaeon]|nr:asparagine synthetase [Candidatus Bathyarchaeota archaeon]